MNRHAIGCILIYFLILLLLPSNIWAFDEDGFKSGMKKADVMNRLRTMNFNKLDDKETVVSAFDVPLKEGSRGYSFVFCENKLVEMVKNLPGKVKALIMMTEKYSLLYGEPEVSAASSFQSNAEIYRLSLVWKLNDGDKILLSLDLVNPDNDLSVGINVIYKTRNTCNK
jgi:hypothetical protein